MFIDKLLLVLIITLWLIQERILSLSLTKQTKDREAAKKGLPTKKKYLFLKLEKGKI